MTSRVHNEPSAWTHESRARSLPASGAYSPASLSRPTRLQPRGPDVESLPEQPGRGRLAVLMQPVIHLRLSGLPDRQRDLKSLAIYSAFSHLRRSSLAARLCQGSI